MINDVTPPVPPLNDVDVLRQEVEAAPDSYAAIILDLLPNRAGLLRISEEFVHTARDLATRYGIVLIIDEVISLRLGFNGFSGEYGVSPPDLLTTGKLIGGGFPVGAVAGKAELMAEVDPTRPGSLPHGGTFSGNPVSMAAGGSVALRLFTQEEVKRLNHLGDTTRDTVNAKIADAAGKCAAAALCCARFRRVRKKLTSRLSTSCGGHLTSAACSVHLQTCCPCPPLWTKRLRETSLTAWPTPCWPWQTRTRQRKARSNHEDCFLPPRIGRPRGSPHRRCRL